MSGRRIHEFFALAARPGAFLEPTVDVAPYVKVCDLDELPPGKGKVVQVGSREVVLYNREGRVFAAREERAPPVGSQAAAQALEPPPTCRHPGSHFEAEQEDSPARVRAHTAYLP